MVFMPLTSIGKARHNSRIESSLRQSHLLLFWYGFCDISVTLCNDGVTLSKKILDIHPRSDSTIAPNIWIYLKMHVKCTHVLIISKFHIIIFLKFRTCFSLLLNWNTGYQGWNSQNAGQNNKQGIPWSDCFFRSSLIWACPVCLCLFGRQLVFKILEHLP